MEKEGTYLAAAARGHWHCYCSRRRRRLCPNSHVTEERSPGSSFLGLGMQSRRTKIAKEVKRTTVTWSHSKTLQGTSEVLGVSCQTSTGWSSPMGTSTPTSSCSTLQPACSQRCGESPKNPQAPLGDIRKQPKPPPALPGSNTDSGSNISGKVTGRALFQGQGTQIQTRAGSAWLRLTLRTCSLSFSCSSWDITRTSARRL